MLTSEARRDWPLFERVVYGVPRNVISSCFGKLGFGRTYGALKNCSSTTYMPRKISVNRKYLPARSRVFSPSSQRCGRGSRNDEVDEPAGSAARLELVEKFA